MTYCGIVEKFNYQTKTNWLAEEWWNDSLDRFIYVFIKEVQ